jgi:hypothetical protein
MGYGGASLIRQLANPGLRTGAHGSPKRSPRPEGALALAFFQAAWRRSFARTSGEMGPDRAGSVARFQT